MFVNIVYLLSRSVHFIQIKLRYGPLNSLCYLYRQVISIGTHAFNQCLISVNDCKILSFVIDRKELYVLWPSKMIS